MFQRIIHEHWHDLVPVIAFILTSAVFIAAFVRALLARKETVSRMAALPLDVPLEPLRQDPGCSETCQRCASCRRHETSHNHC